MLHKTVIPAGIINLARATADHLIIEIAAPQFYNFYGALVSITENRKSNLRIETLRIGNRD